MFFKYNDVMSLKHNLNATHKFFRSLTKQVKFAGGQALNDTSIQSTKAIESDLTSKYDITTSWVKAGNRFGGRKTRPKVNDEAVSQIVGITRGGSVGSLQTSNGKEHWIYDHETGGVRRAKTGGDILIPTKALLERIGSAKGKRGRRKVSTLLENKNNETFERNIKGNTYLMMRRTKKKQDGKRRKRNKNGTLSKRKNRVAERAFPMFLLKSQVKIQDTLDLYKTVNKTYEKNFNANFKKRFSTALKTMRVK